MVVRLNDGRIHVAMAARDAMLLVPNTNAPCESLWIEPRIPRDHAPCSA